MASKNKDQRLFFFFLVLLGLVGGALRFYNLNWDSGHYFHPDERNVVTAVYNLDIPKQLNPRFFSYGSFPFYLYKASIQAIAWFNKNPSWGAGGATINIVGRTWSAFFGTLSIFLIYLLTRELIPHQRKSFDFGLLAATIFAFTPFLIQSAHYSTTESLLVFFITLISFLTLKYIQKPRLKTLFFLIVNSAAAVATKVSGLSFLMIPVLAFSLLITRQKSKRRYYLISLIIFSLGTVCMFFVFSPYTLLDYFHFKAALDYESGVALGRLQVPYTLQFFKTTPFLFQLKSMFFTLGPLVTLAGLIGFLLFLKKSLFSKKIQALPFLTFFTTYFLYVGSWYAKQVRYFVPLYPYFIIFTAFLFFAAKDNIMAIRNKVKRKRLTLAWQALVIITTSTSILHGLAFFSIYTRTQTRVAASQWIFDQIPPKAKIYTEHWDDSLPLPLKKYPSPSQYEIEQLAIYDQDDEQKRQYYATKLSQGDYIILCSRRLWGTLIHLEEKYPLTARYYQLLFSEKMGFKKVAEFSSYPCFGYPFFCFRYLKDETAEETFQVFDHPRVIIFQNQNRFSQETLARLLSW
jgi:hypothetical protein